MTQSEYHAREQRARVLIPLVTKVEEEEAPGSGPGQALEPCAICRTRISAHELIPVQLPHGTTLACRTCYDGRKACAFCGARLPVKQLITISVSGGAGLGDHPVGQVSICTSHLPPPIGPEDPGN